DSSGAMPAASAIASAIAGSTRKFWPRSREAARPRRASSARTAARSLTGGARGDGCAREGAERSVVALAAREAARARGGDHRRVVGAQRERREHRTEAVLARRGGDARAQALVGRHAAHHREPPEPLVLERAPR